MSDSQQGERSRPPKFHIDKKQGIRRLLHAAIRMTLDGEDPFAINMLGQSADKVLLDLLKHAKISDPALMEERIVPEHRNDFFRIHRETFNFLKHANKDPEEKLPVFDIVNSNELLLFVNVVRFKSLYLEITRHMQILFSLVSVLHPGLIRWDKMGAKGEQILSSRKTYQHMTRRDSIHIISGNANQDPAFIKERIEDLVIVDEANHVRLSGKPGPKRLRIPNHNSNK